MSTPHTKSAEKPGTLLISPQLERPIVRLQQLMGGDKSLKVFISNPIKVHGDRRGIVDRLKYYWVDPLLTMLRLLPRIHKYEQVICYYHRTGYWVGIYRLLFPKSKPSITVWIGFAPNVKLKGIKGWLKEKITYLAVRGHSVIICNSNPLIEVIRQRFPLVKDRLAFVRWGGGNPQECANYGGDQESTHVNNVGYIFSGGRMNRDFETVLTAVRELGCPAVFAVPGDHEFRGDIPENVKIYRDIPSERFLDLVSNATAVVIALERPDISSGQVVLAEAMKRARPIIVTKLAGIDDYVTDGREALFVQPHAPADLIEKIKILLADKRLRQKLSTSAYEKYKTSFNSDTFAQDIFTVLSDISDWKM